MASVQPSKADDLSTTQDRTFHDAILGALAIGNGKRKVEQLTDALMSWQGASESSQKPQLLVHVLKHSYDLEPFESRSLKESDHSDFMALKKVCSALDFTLYIAPIKREIVGAVWVDRSRARAFSRSRPDFKNTNAAFVTGVHVDGLTLGGCSEVIVGGAQEQPEGVVVRDREIIQKDVWKERTPEVQVEETPNDSMEAEELEFVHRYSGSALVLVPPHGTTAFAVRRCFLVPSDVVEEVLKDIAELPFEPIELAGYFNTVLEAAAGSTQKPDDHTAFVVKGLLGFFKKAPSDAITSYCIKALEAHPNLDKEVELKTTLASLKKRKASEDAEVPQKMAKQEGESARKSQ